MTEARKRLAILMGDYRLRPSSECRRVGLPLCKDGIGSKFAMRRKHLHKVRYKWDELPTMEKDLYHAKYHDNEAYMTRRALKQGVRLTGTLHACEDCIAGKAKRRIMKKISSYVRGTRQFGRVYADCSGPFKVRALKGARYILVLVDDYSRRKFSYLMKDKTKESILLAFKLFQNEHVLPLGQKIRILRTDNGTEFVNTLVVNWLCDQGIIREYISDYAPHQNAVVETAIRDIKNMGVTLMNAANLKSGHGSLWGEACLTATSILNDSPAAGNPSYQSPNEVSQVKSLPLALRYQFGSRSFVIDETSQLFDSRVHECLFVGYAKNKPKNTLRFLKLSTGAIIESTNFTVIDGMMLFSEEKVRFDDILPVDESVPEGIMPTHEDTIHTGLVFSDCDATDNSEGEDDDSDPDTGPKGRNATVPATTATTTVSATAAVVAPTTAIPLIPPDAAEDQYDINQRAERDNDRDTGFDPEYHAPVYEDGDTSVEDDDMPTWNGGDAHDDGTEGLEADLNIDEADMDLVGSISDVPPPDNDFLGQQEYMNRYYAPAVSQEEGRTLRNGKVRGAAFFCDDTLTRTANAHDLLLRVFICANGDIRIPKGYADALELPQAKEWLLAMRMEFSSLMKNHTWDLVPTPPGVKIVGSRWVMTVKFGADGTIKRYKARFVVQGFSQTEGIDYFETFAPVVSLTTVRMVLAMAAVQGWNVYQMDVETAFLNSLVSEDVYVRQAPGFVVHGKEQHVYKLRKSLYGLKQSPRNWNNCFTTVILGLGLTQSENDKCLFYWMADGKIVLLCVYVDDIILTGNCEHSIQHVKQTLCEQFIMQDLGLSNHLLGITVVQSSEGIKLSQGGYVGRMLSEFDLTDVRSRSTPADEDMYLQNILAAFNKDARTIEFDYRGAIGCLMFLSNCTRPDISNAVRFLSSFVTNYTDFHVGCVKKVLKYLEGTPDLGLMFRKSDGKLRSHVGSFSKDDLIALHAGYPSMKLLQAFSDASWADNYADATSSSGIVIEYDGCLILWKSVKQRVAAQSSMESEYIAMSKCVTELEVIMNVFRELGALRGGATELVSSREDAKGFIEDAVQCWTDNIASICVGNASASTRRSRHINREFHNVKDAIRRFAVKFGYVKTVFNKADIETKNLGPLKHKAGIKMLGMC